MVVSMRIFNQKDINKVKQISGNFSFAHGNPIHIGDPIEIGINNILSPDWGDSPKNKNDDEKQHVCRLWIRVCCWSVCAAT